MLMEYPVDPERFSSITLQTGPTSELHEGAARDHKRENSVPMSSNTFTLHPKIECPMDPRQHLPRSAQKSGQAANWWAFCHAEAPSAIRRLPRSPGICLLSPCTQG